jgi:hypothetical protein
MSFVLRCAIALFACLAVPTAVFGAGNQPPAEKYRGVILLGTAYPDQSNDIFFETARKAIDMVRSLPKEKWNQSRYILRIHYDPPSKYRRPLPGHYQNILAVYRTGGIDGEGAFRRWPGPLVVFKDLHYSAALHLALSIVGNGLHAREEYDLLVLRKQIEAIDSGGVESSTMEYLKLIREFEEKRRLYLKQAGPDELLKANCHPRVAMLNAYRHLFPNDPDLNSWYRELNDDGCL